MDQKGRPPADRTASRPLLLRTRGRRPKAGRGEKVAARACVHAWPRHAVREADVRTGWAGAADKMAEGGGCPERPDAETQKSELGALMRTTLQRGAQWYLIDSRWFKQWKKYVGFDSWDIYSVGEHNVFPGPIDNSGLFADTESQTLKEHLIDELDYVLVPAEAWNKLLTWYGCVEGQQPIVRKVLEHGLFVKHCKVEVYLLELKLCENGDPTKVLSCHFSKADTIGDSCGARGLLGMVPAHLTWGNKEDTQIQRVQRASRRDLSGDLADSVSSAGSVLTPEISFSLFCGTHTIRGGEAQGKFCTCECSRSPMGDVWP
ncbi:ubiquitin carboxyl-terminal hydrolase 4 isoform X10 [Manis javanica]|uniref:ubiquitin carboxyl-terminal hydrolase 4 isoform X10 n=1 Tax=Manis javanica TaxID=9974 RepID=UPI003C6CF024